MPQTTCHVVIPTEGGPVPTAELTLALRVFRGLYHQSVEYLYMVEGWPGGEYTEESILRHALALTRQNPGDEDIQYLSVRGDLFDLDQDDDLYTLDITRNNPIELSVLGLAYPLAIAVVLSGGKLQLGPLKVELPPLGKGVEALRKALRPQSVERLKQAGTKLKPLPPLRS